MAAKMSSLWRNLRSYQIYGANTNVGKTIMSTILLKAHTRKFPSEKTWYLKPVSTGPMDEADDRHISHFTPQVQTKCLYQFDEAVSPHIAAQSSAPLSDKSIQDQVLSHISSCATSGSGFLLLETAGGVHSPTPSGSSQADLYRPLRLPLCLAADHHLGGISATISAFESLHIRGYDLELLCQFEDSTYKNHEYLSDYFSKRNILSLSLPPPPEREVDLGADRQVMTTYYEKMSSLDIVEETLHHLIQKHNQRILNLEEMSTSAHKTIWYPFTQHTSITPSTILAIDSASGDFFQTYASPPSPTSPTSLPQNKTSNSNRNEIENLLTPTFDGSASWWTQGLGHASPSLTLASAYASGRYGHVMFAGTIHTPALTLANTLLSTMSNPRLSRVFYSDNGSTGMEVAVKMALTASCVRYGWIDKGEGKEGKNEEVGVIGLKGSYHGDTIGAMDASEPSTYNEKVHWYEGKGYWFDFPVVKMKRGEWVVEAPEGMEDEFGQGRKFECLGDVFDIQNRLESKEAGMYRTLIEETLERLIKNEGRRFGALVMEPIILGAGGMLFADPLFQHLLATTIRTSPLFSPPPSSPSSTSKTWTGLPIIHDEVFTGLYRLGSASSSTLIQTHPDISVHAKLLTGGLLPLCATLASESIYEAFLGDEKRDALLHGHSYTAHAVGCNVAVESLRELNALSEGGAWGEFVEDWRDVDGGEEEKEGGVWSVWGKEFVRGVSMSRDVESVVALGSVLVINLMDDHAGYSSTAAIGLQKKLLAGSEDFKIHNRVLGNVLYLMASQTSKPETLKSIETLLMKHLLQAH